MHSQSENIAKSFRGGGTFLTHTVYGFTQKDIYETGCGSSKCFVHR